MNNQTLLLELYTQQQRIGMQRIDGDLLAFRHRDYDLASGGKNTVGYFFGMTRKVLTPDCVAFCRINSSNPGADV